MLASDIAMESKKTTQEHSPAVAVSEIQPYLAWLERDNELIALYQDFKLRGMQTRIIYGKFAVVSSGRP